MLDQPKPCDPFIFRTGHHIATWQSFGMFEVEGFIERVREFSGQPVDWHYAGGRVVVLALGNLDRVRAAIEILEPARQTLMRVHTKVFALENGCPEIAGSILNQKL